MTHQIISIAGIPVIDTTFYGGNYTGTFPAVVKPSDGHGGNLVSLVHNPNEFRESSLTIPVQRTVIQKVASDIGLDLRVYVIGRQIIASILRNAQSDFRSNYCLGGNASLYSLSVEQLSLVNQVIELFNFGLVGIDFIFNDGGLIFNEIEDVVGSRMLYATTDIDIADKYLEFISENWKKR